MTTTYDCPNDSVPKPERRAHVRGPADHRVEHLFNGFENAIRNLSQKGREPYWGGWLRAMRAEFAALMRAKAGACAPVPDGWTFNEARIADDHEAGDGVWQVGHLNEDDVFSPIVTVDTGNYFQPQDAEPMARAILARVTAPAEGPAEPSEAERLRAAQAAAVMPMIGPLLDAWEGIYGDVKGAIKIEAPGLARHLGAINRAMEEAGDPCRMCNGQGMVGYPTGHPAADSQPCPDCKGSGEVPFEVYAGPEVIDDGLRNCDACAGTGGARTAPQDADRRKVEVYDFIARDLEAAGLSPWRVGEFISSANRPQHVLMIAVGEKQIAEYGAHRDFVRWVSA